MKKIGFAVLLVGLGAGMAWADAPDFEKYRVILDRKPFGVAPSPDAGAANVPPAESFAKTIRMSAILQVEAGVKVGLIDTSNNKNFFLCVGDTEEGIELVSANYEDEEAVLKKGSEMAVIKLQSGDIQTLTPAEQQARLNANQPQAALDHRPSYAERRMARLQERQAEPPPQPKYTGEELEKHLKEYQMEVIRQGLPPLPIPLTPDMDDQLVKEGVLPPAQQ